MSMFDGTYFNIPQLTKGLTPTNVIVNREKKIEAVPFPPGAPFDIRYENGRFANAIDSKGNLWVWIPRFTYKINGPFDVDVICSNKLTDDLKNGTFKKHPAFTFNGKELTGFWVMKYLASDIENGAIASVNGKTPAKATVNEAFKKCLKLKDDIFPNDGVTTHLIKNIEWGAVALLNYALTEVLSNSSINPSLNNVTNIFDIGVMNEKGDGGCRQLVASYVDDASNSLKNGASDLYNAAAQYKDVLPIGTGDKSPQDCFKAGIGKTDGMLLHEFVANPGAYDNSTSKVGWNNLKDHGPSTSIYPYNNYSCFLRGTDGPGSFEAGAPSQTESFRAVLTIEPVIEIIVDPLNAKAERISGNEMRMLDCFNFSILEYVRFLFSYPSTVDGYTVDIKLDETVINHMTDVKSGGPSEPPKFYPISITEKQFNDLPFGEHKIKITVSNTIGKSSDFYIYFVKTDFLSFSVNVKPSVADRILRAIAVTGLFNLTEAEKNRISIQVKKLDGSDETIRYGENFFLQSQKEINLVITIPKMKDRIECHGLCLMITESVEGGVLL